MLPIEGFLQNFPFVNYHLYLIILTYTSPIIFTNSNNNFNNMLDNHTHYLTLICGIPCTTSTKDNKLTSRLPPGQTRNKFRKMVLEWMNGFAPGPPYQAPKVLTTEPPWSSKAYCTIYKQIKIFVVTKQDIWNQM